MVAADPADHRGTRLSSELDDDLGGELLPPGRRWTFVRLALFCGLTLLLAIDQRRRLGSMVPGDSGDSFLIMSLLEWGGDRSVRLFDHYWDGPMFAGGVDVMAYTDTFLPLVIPFKLIETVTGSRVIAFNTLYLSSWLLCAEATYHLARRLVSGRGAATIAAVGFTFSTIRLTQSNHFQLAWAGLIPLSLLLLMRLLDRPTPWRAIAVAAAVLAQVLTSAYYGLMLLVFTGTVAVVAIGRELWRERRPTTALWGPVTFLIALGLPIAYVQRKYASAEAGTVPRSGYPRGVTLTLGDLRSPALRSSYMRRVPWLDTDTIVRSSENYAYVGIIVIALVPLAAVLLATRRAHRRDLFWATRDWCLLAALGVGVTLIAVGRGPIFGVRMPFYDIAEGVIPGLGSMVAIVRLFVFGQLLLSMLAAASLGWLLRSVAGATTRLLVCSLLVLAVTVESQMSHSMVTVVEPADGSVYDRLDDLEPGVAVIVPISPPALGALFAFTEATRMVLGSDDEMHTVNGYSGYTPDGYEARGNRINTFPSADSIVVMRELGVRYVVLPSAPVDAGMWSISDAINQSGYGYLEPAEIERRLAELPPELLVARHNATDGVVIELAP